MKHRIAIALIGMCMVLPRGSAPAYAQGADAEEIRLGQVYARRLESQYRLVQDAGVLERVTRIGKIVAAASDRPGLPYTFKVLDLEISNALSLPGGFIYVTRGLLSFVRFDHELAAVLAHEIAHPAHGRQLMIVGHGHETNIRTLMCA